MRTALLALLLAPWAAPSLVPSAARAEPIQAAYFYGYMSVDHLDSLAAAGFNRAVIKSIGDSLTARQEREFKAWIERGARLGLAVVPAWSLQAPSRLRTMAADRRYTLGDGTVEREVGCPADSLFWRTAFHDRAREILRAFPALGRLLVDLEIYTGARTHYNGGPCRCAPCRREYAEYVGSRPVRIATLEEFQESRLVDALVSQLARLAAFRPGLELSAFDLDMDNFVHRAMARALARTRTPTFDFTERTYSAGAVRLPLVRANLQNVGLAAPVVGGLYLQRFPPAQLGSAIAAILAQSEGCFIFTTFSLWQSPDKLTGAYAIPASQRDYWSALRSALLRADLEPSAIGLAAEAIDLGGALEVRFTLHNRGRLAVPAARWFLESAGRVLDQGAAALGARDSVVVSRTLVPDLEAGLHLLTLRIDGQGAAEHELGNNARTRTLTVRPLSVPAGLRFPSTPIADDFERSSGAVGDAWAGASGITVSSRRLKVATSSAIAPIWVATTLAPDQEAYVTLAKVSSSALRQGLLLKAQGRDVAQGAVEVRYDGVARQVAVATLVPGAAWVDRGPPIPVRFESGDVLGARALANGTVEVYRNGVLLGTRALGDWPFAARGGRIGLTLQKASSTRLDDFGGGSVTLGGHVPTVPSADPGFPSAPVLDSFTRPDGPLAGQWTGAVDGVIVDEGRFKPTTSQVVAAVWDGAVYGPHQEAYVKFLKKTSGSARQGLLLRVQGRSIESGALEVRYDAPQKKVFVASLTPGAGWRDHGEGIAVKLSDNDVLGARVSPTGVVTVYRNGARLGERSAADWVHAARGGRIGLVLANASSTRWDDFGGGTVGGGPVTVAGPGLGTDPAEPRDARGPAEAPAALTLAPAAPNPFTHETTLRFGLPQAAAVDLGVFDVQGRQVAVLARATLPAGWHAVRWSGRGADGGRLAAGVYLVRVRAGAAAQVRKLVLTRP